MVSKTRHTDTPLSPADLGAPESLASWRPGQEEAFLWASETLSAPGPRHVAMGVPTGVGKSLLAYLLAVYATGGRTVVLTSRLGLADQYRATFPDTVEVRGRRHYKTRWEYTAALDAAKVGRIVITSYAFWLAVHQFGRGLGDDISLVVMDEASEEFSELSGHLETVVRPSSLAWFAHVAKRAWGVEFQLARWCDAPLTDLLAWGQWAATAGYSMELVRKAARESKAPDPEKWGREEKEADEAMMLLSGKLKYFASSCRSGLPGRKVLGPHAWVIEEAPSYEPGSSVGVKLAAVWPAEHSGLLFQDAPRTVHMSATLRPASLDLVGIPRAEYVFREWPHPFPPAHRRVLWIPTIFAVEARATERDWQTWVTTIDQVIEAAGEDAKGIIHTVSYKRAQMLLNLSRNGGRGIFMTHGRRDTADVVAAFRASDPPRVLVSPAIVSGWDIPEALYQVIGKLPFSSGQSALEKARKEKNPDLAPYLCAQAIVQTAGRITRGPSYEERGTSLILDNSWSWFGPKYRSFFPSWFKVQRADYVPQQF